MKILILLLLAVSSLTVKSQTYYVVRHAEKASTESMMNAANNPPLTEAGGRRAEALKDFLKDKSISYIFSTNTIRTMSTAKPTSELTGVKILFYTNPVGSFIDSLKSLKKNILIVGHSNTVDDIVNALTSTKSIPADLQDREYDNLYIVTMDGGKATFKAVKFGKASE